MKSEPSAFWNKKILTWEKDKYFTKPMSLINFDVNSSVKTRLELARSILKEIAPSLTVLELGCGSALLMNDIIAFGANKYIAIDISPVAIEAAKQKALNSDIISKVELLTNNIKDIAPIKVDVCFSLGLFDWLDLKDINFLHKQIDAKYYFHSFSEKKTFSPQQIFHKIYVYLMYGYKNNQNIPKYFTENELRMALDNKMPARLKFFRHSKLSFGTLVYDLPKSIEKLK